MEGLLTNFRRSAHHQTTHHLLIHVDGYDTRVKSEKLLGKKVTWKSPAGKEIKGEIKAVHGNKGIVRAIFEKSLPGQAIAQKVKVE